MKCLRPSDITGRQLSPEETLSKTKVVPLKHHRFTTQRIGPDRLWFVPRCSLRHVGHESGSSSRCSPRSRKAGGGAEQERYERGGRGRYFGQQILLDEHDEASGVLPLMSGSS